MGRKRIIELKTSSSTIQLGEELVPYLKGNSFVALKGDLGAGKTTFVQGLAQGLGIHTPILSPTYVLLNAYHGKLNLYHFDLYRLKHSEDFFSLGFDEYLQNEGITVIEWPEKVLDLLPQPTLELQFFHDVSSHSRRVEIEFGDAISIDLLKWNPLTVSKT